MFVFSSVLDVAVMPMVAIPLMTILGIGCVTAGLILLAVFLIEKYIKSKK
ncbi:MAG: hypothetical protein MJ102_06240 [Clostridia bacterium]|nr:hypothetical protein [Clostridia bacterium]